VRSYLQKTLHKNRVGGVAQGVGPKFKPQYCKKTKNKKQKNKLFPELTTIDRNY
jgi:hypothetical protein